MNRFTMLVALASALPLALGGCAASSQHTQTGQTQTAATHYWESTASSKQYNADNAACEQKTKVDAEGKLDPNSTSFQAYRDCMISQGYSLRTY
ncbi:MAG: hypothetical protein PVH91_07110 [Pseudomonadales bacterium]|jgi:hypothetical protein